MVLYKKTILWRKVIYLHSIGPYSSDEGFIISPSLKNVSNNWAWSSKYLLRHAMNLLLSCLTTKSLVLWKFDYKANWVVNACCNQTRHCWLIQMTYKWNFSGGEIWVSSIIKFKIKPLVRYITSLKITSIMQK